MIGKAWTETDLDNGPRYGLRFGKDNKIRGKPVISFLFICLNQNGYHVSYNYGEVVHHTLKKKYNILNVQT